MTGVKPLSRWIRIILFWDNLNLRIELRALRRIGYLAFPILRSLGPSIERIHLAGPRDLTSIEEAYSGDRTPIRQHSAESVFPW